MMSVSTCTAAMAGSYYEKDNYYTRDQSVADKWQGELCKEIGLKENEVIKLEEFKAVIENSGKCAGYDVTFSAPKSVSVAAEINPELRADMQKAHQEAVKRTLADIEKNEIGCRVTKNAETTFQNTGKMAAAKFEHGVSRNGDMQMHTHCVIANITEHNGKEYAVDGHKLFEGQKIYGQEYRTNLANNLQKMGYEVEVTNSEKGFFELKEIRPDVREHFSTRRAEIEQEMAKSGQTGAEAAQAANLKTRQAKQKIDLDEKRLEWQKEIAELNQAAPTKTKIENPGSLSQKAAFDRAIDRLAKQNFAFTEKQITQAAMAEGVAINVQKSTVSKCLAKSNLVKLTPKNADGMPVGNYYTTNENITTEQKILDNVLLNKGKMVCMSQAQTSKTLQNVCAKNNWQLGTEQQNVVSHIATSKDQFIAVRGLAGTGKTFTLNAVREVLEKNGYEVKGMAATGQAADELAHDAKIEGCSTIHRTLNAAEKQSGNAIKGEDYTTKTKWNLEGLKLATKPTVRFVDEASLVDNNLLLQTQKLALARGEKLVLIGDNRQMPPVGAGNAYANLVQQGSIATAELSDIRRQKNPELLKAVKEAVQGKTKTSLDMIAKNIQEVPARIRRLNAMSKAYTSLSPAEQAETLCLAATNKDRTEINSRIRKQLVKQGQLKDGKSFDVITGKNQMLQQRKFSQGDRVVFLKNDSRLGVKNGTKGDITRIEGNNITVKTASGKELAVNMQQYNNIDYGYCMTPHKAQGATVHRALINLDSKDVRLNSKNSYYVGISRAKQNITLFCDNRAKLEPQLANFTKKLTGNDFKPMEGKVGLGKAKMAGRVAKGAGGIAGILPGPLKLIGKLLTATTKMVGKVAEFAKKPLEVVQAAAKSEGGEMSKGLNLKDNSALRHAMSGLNSVDKESAIDSNSSIEESVKMHH